MVDHRETLKGNILKKTSWQKGRSQASSSTQSERENNDVAGLINVGENKNSVEGVAKYPAYPN